jgi:threonine/homoserine/homoserine lactone efflux protein
MMMFLYGLLVLAIVGVLLFLGLCMLTMPSDQEVQRRRAKQRRQQRQSALRLTASMMDVMRHPDEDDFLAWWLVDQDDD